MFVHKPFIYWSELHVYWGYTQNSWECYTNRDTASWDWKEQKEYKPKGVYQIPKFCTEETGWLNSAVNATVRGKKCWPRRQGLEPTGPNLKAPEKAGKKHRGLFSYQDCEIAWQLWLYFPTSSHLLNQDIDNYYFLPVIMLFKNNLGLLNE